MKFLKILIFCGLSAFATAMDNDGKGNNKPNDKQIVASNLYSHLDIVSEDNNIQDIIRAYLYEWYISKSVRGHSSWGADAPEIGFLAATSDNKKIVSVSKFDLIKIWDTKLDSLLKQFAYQQGCWVGTIRGLSITGNNKFLILGLDKLVHLLNLDSGEVVKGFEYFRNYPPISAIVITSDNKLIITGHADGKIRIWDYNTGKLINTLYIPTFYNKNGAINSLAITADNNYIISGCTDGSLKKWNLSNGELLKIISHDAFASRRIFVATDGKKIVNCLEGRTFEIRDFKTGKLLHTFLGNSNICDTIGSIALTADGKTIICGVNNGIIQKWDNLAVQLEKQKINISPYKIYECANKDCENSSTKQCARCKKVYYCSTDCQSADWHTHRLTCMKK